MHPPVYLTPQCAPVGGVLKERPEDFLVEEIPAYQPSGAGEHIVLLVEKRNLSTLELVEVLARHFGVRTRAIGYAGLKDRLAVTRQVVSIHAPGRTPESFPALDHPRIRVLWADLHANKIRRGHLAGNRFSIRIRQVEPTAVLVARRVLDALARAGVPNRAGEQRFGFLGNNHLVGRALLLDDAETAVRLLLGRSAEHPDIHAEGRTLFEQGDYREAIGAFPPSARTERAILRALAAGAPPREAVRRMPRVPRHYYVTAFQSAVFNSVLDARLRDGTLRDLVEGDLAFVHDRGAVFSVDAAQLADPSVAERLARIELSPSGPMWGDRMLRAGGAPGHAELRALEAAGVTPGDLHDFVRRERTRFDGARRPLRVPLRDPAVEGGVDAHGTYVRCAFELPPGAFATVVMQEVMKAPPGPATPRDAPATDPADSTPRADDDDAHDADADEPGDDDHDPA